MPKRAQYTVSWSSERVQYLLSDAENVVYGSLPEERVGWLKWLEEHHSFAFQGCNGRLNLLKEKRGRGGEGYWYAYQRHEAGMVKRYIGRSEQLSMERLEEIAVLLLDKDETTHIRPPVSQSDLLSAARNRQGTSTARRGAGRPIRDTQKAASVASTYPENAPRANSMSIARPIQFEPLLLSKLQLPRLQKSLLPREHLLEMLDKGLERKLTFISAPAGYGKTTLVGQWAAERSTHTNFPHVAWVTLDEGDNDPIRFWRYIITACQQFRADFGQDVLDLLLAHRLPPFKPLEMMLTALLNELSQLEHTGVLILDDFHVIGPSQVSETLNFLLDHLPTTLHLIILIRGDPPFSLARLRASNELLGLYPPHLCFSLEETRVFLELELSFTPPPKLLRQICERMDGWPAGLRLLSKDLHFSGNVQEVEHRLAAIAGSHWSFQDYFLTEVLHTLPQEQQEFLLQTCILPRVTAALCNVVTGRADSARLIDILCGGDLFLIPLDGTGEWTRYHSLFAEAMQQEAQRRLGDTALRQIAARASSWYEEHGLLTEAIETALNAAAFTRSANLIKQLMESKQQHNSPTIPELYSLKRWLERLPDDELERNPELCLHYAMTLLFVSMEGPRVPDGKERIQHLLQVAEQKWRDANSTAKLAEVFAFRALLARQEGRMLQALTWARQSLAWLPQEDRIWRNLSLTVVGVGEMLGGKLDNARQLLLEALAISEQQGNATYARATRGMLSGVSFEQGELRHAAAQFRQIQVEARLQEDYDDIARTQLGLARIAYQWNNLEEAQQAAHEALTIGEQMNVEEFYTTATVLLTLIEHARGQTVQAQQRLTIWLARSQTPITPHSYQLLRDIQATLACIQLASGNLAAVERWFASNARSEEILPLLQQQREQLLWARLLLAQGEISTAIEGLESLHVAAFQTGHVYFRLEIQVVLLLAYSRQGGAQVRASEQLRDLLATTRSEGYLRIFLNEGKELATVLHRFLPTLHEKVLLAYAKHILNTFELEMGTGALEALPVGVLLREPLSPQEHKVLRLLAAGSSNAQIAHEFVVSVNTVRTQLQSIYRKLEVNNRVEASIVARQLALL